MLSSLPLLLKHFWLFGSYEKKKKKKKMTFSYLRKSVESTNTLQKSVKIQPKYYKNPTIISQNRTTRAWGMGF
jgi:hypothetical protein